MIRFRSICTVKYGHFAEALSLSEQLNEISRARGWRTASFFTPVGGEQNVLIAEYDYADIASCDAETKAAMSDAEWMKTFRLMGDLIYPQSARTELLDEAPHLA